MPGSAQLSSGFGEDTERGWLFKRAAPSSVIPPRGSEPQGTAQTGWEWETAPGEDWSSHTVGARDGHKLGECLTHFCTPQHEQPSPWQVYHNFLGWQCHHSQFLSLLAAGCPSWGQLEHVLHPLMAPSTSQTRWQTQHQQPEPWLGFLGTSLGLGSSRKENLPAPKPLPGCRSPVLPVRDGKQSISPGLDKLRAVGRSILGGLGGTRSPLFPLGWSYLVVGDLFLRSQCTASKKAAFQNRRLCLQGGGRCWEWPIGIV